MWHGRGNESGPNLLELEKLLVCPKLRLVYHQDRVWVFEVIDLLYK